MRIYVIVPKNLIIHEIPINYQLNEENETWVAEEDLEEEWAGRDRELVDQPIVNVLNVGIQHHILVEHHVLAWLVQNVAPD